ncbi:hypothetical protein ACWGE0_22800 [Lentzea sp. NPDC054927]
MAGSWVAVARTTAVVLALGAAIHYFDLEVDVFGVTFSAAKTCQAEVVEPPAPYPAPHTPVPQPSPQVNQDRVQEPLPANPPA